MSWPAPALGAIAIVVSAIAASPAFATTTTTPSIADVQGPGATTPIPGQTVTVEGVVTAELPSFGGLYIQSTESAGIAGASDGIFVRVGHADVSSGDLVSVTGSVDEVAGQTEIAATAVTLTEAAVGLPAATALPDSVVGAARESFEGMLVVPTGTYLLDSTDDATGSLVVSAGTGTADAASRLSIDDGYNTPVATQPFLLADTVVKPGDTLIAATIPAVLGEGASGYALEPTVPLTADSDLAYKPKFHVASPRLGGAPVLNP